MKTTTHYPDFEVTELTNEDAAEVICRNSGLELETPANAHRRVVTMEEQRIAADLAYNRMKNSGELQRRESDRAIDEQFRWTVGV